MIWMILVFLMILLYIDYHSTVAALLHQEHRHCSPKFIPAINPMNMEVKLCYLLGTYYVLMEQYTSKWRNVL